MTNKPAITPDELVEVGVTLFGDRWQSDMRDVLQLGDTARIRAWLTGRRPIPAGIRGELVQILLEHAARARSLAERLGDQK